MGLALLDVLFLAVLWLIAGGYVSLGTMDQMPVLEQVRARGAITRVWATLHAPVDTIFGPYLFPYFRAHGGGLATMLSEVSYFVLCIAQMFVAGFLIGVVVAKVVNSQKRS